MSDIQPPDASSDSRQRTRHAITILAAGMFGGIAVGLGIGVLIGDVPMGLGIGMAGGCGAGGVLASLIYWGDL